MLDNEYDFNIEDLFKDDTDEEVNQEPTQDATSNEETNDSMTKAVSERINSVRKKTETETEERIAKELGYASYADMLKDKESKLMKEAGLDEEETSNLVNKLVEQRLANDPRLKKLEEIEKREKNDFVTSQLKDISKIAGTTFTSIEQLDKEVLSLWEKTGNLKQAYLAVKAEEIIAKKQNKNTDSLDHLAGTSNGASSSKKVRALTADEKDIWRSIIPDITEEELNKKTIEI